MGKGQRQRLAVERQRAKDKTNNGVGLDPIQQIRLSLFDSSKDSDTQFDMTEKQARKFLGVAEDDTKEEFLKKYSATLELCMKQASFHLIQSKLTAAKKCLDVVYQRKEASQSGAEPSTSTSTVELPVRNNGVSWAEPFCSPADHVESVVGSSSSLQVVQQEGTQQQNLSELHVEQSIPRLEDDDAGITISDQEFGNLQEEIVSVSPSLPLTEWNEPEVEDFTDTDVEQRSTASEASIESTDLIVDLNKELEEKNKMIKFLELKLKLKETEILLLCAERDDWSRVSQLVLA